MPSLLVPRTALQLSVLTFSNLYHHLESTSTVILKIRDN